MAVIVPDEGEERLLDMLVGGIDLSLLVLKLFQSNTTPDQDSVYGDFSPATYSGVGSFTPAFGSASIVGHKGKITDSVARVFAHSGGGTSNTIYGWYGYDSATNVCLWAERFASPFVMANLGDQITIQMSVTLNSEF